MKRKGIPKRPKRPEAAGLELTARSWAVGLGGKVLVKMQLTANAALEALAQRKQAITRCRGSQALIWSSRKPA